MYRLFLLLVFMSCSSLKKSVITSAVIGGVVGSLGGSVFSPTEEDKEKNKFLFGTLGAAAGAGIAYTLYEDPAKKELNKMLLNKDINEEIPLFDFSADLKDIKPSVNFKPLKKYEVPQEKLPTHLKGKVKKQYIIEYESPEKTIQVGNRTISISPFKAYEHVYE